MIRSTRTIVFVGVRCWTTNSRHYSPSSNSSLVSSMAGALTKCKLIWEMQTLRHGQSVSAITDQRRRRRRSVRVELDNNWPALTSQPTNSRVIMDGKYNLITLAKRLAGKNGAKMAHFVPLNGTYNSWLTYLFNSINGRQVVDWTPTNSLCDVMAVAATRKYSTTRYDMFHYIRCGCFLFITSPRDWWETLR